MNDPSLRNNICSKTIEGLRISCDDIVEFTEDFSRPVNPEYLLSVNTAKSIRRLNSGLGWPLKIYLEYPAQAFLEKCHPLIRGARSQSFPPAQTVIRQSPSITRYGRIDVTVLKNGPQEDIPVCAIELKGLNPPKARVVDDLRRNKEYFANANTGRSQVLLAISAMIRSYKSTKSCEHKVHRLLLSYAHEVQAPNGCSISVMAAKLRDASVDVGGITPQLVAGLIIIEWNTNPADAASANTDQILPT
jgi:hypothetical protein